MKRIMTFPSRIGNIAAISLLLTAICLSAFIAMMKVDEALLCRTIEKHHSDINAFCRGKALESRRFAAVIYSERKNNVNFWDRYDRIRAELGYDSSVGISQVKVSTALWIRHQSNPPENGIPEKVLTLPSVIEELLDDSLNIEIAGQYLCRIIEDFSLTYGRQPNTAELATLYSRGIDYQKKMPDKLIINQIGECALEYFEGPKQRQLFSSSGSDKM